MMNNAMGLSQGGVALTSALVKNWDAQRATGSDTPPMNSVVQCLQYSIYACTTGYQRCSIVHLYRIVVYVFYIHQPCSVYMYSTLKYPKHELALS